MGTASRVIHTYIHTSMDAVVCSLIRLSLMCCACLCECGEVHTVYGDMVVDTRIEHMKYRISACWYW